MGVRAPRRPRHIAPLLALAALGALWAPAPAPAAGDPTMALADVRPGMQCTVRSVVRGTEIASFGGEVIDVVDRQSGDDGPRILVRVSGPAIAGTGIGPGFSGSPIYCPDAAGTQRNIGAISEGVGEYGNTLALATPIGQILGEPPDPRAKASHAPALLRAARPLATPLTVSGLSAPVARAFSAAARRAGRVLLAAPAGPLGSFPVQQLVPGAAMAVALASGDVGLGAIGTVAYADGPTVWGFGHPLDGTGARSLLLQDAYVYTVVGNPVGGGDVLNTYKLAAPGHDLGTLSNDALNAVVGRVGALPPRTELRILARDLDTGRARETQATVADEGGLGLPTGVSGLDLVGRMALLESATRVLRAVPARQSGSMCVRITLRGRARPLRFCNRYVGGLVQSQDPQDAVASNVELAMLTDYATAIELIDDYTPKALQVARVSVSLGVRRGLRQAFVLGAQVPPRVRPGQRIRVRLALQRVRGAREAVTVRLRVPRDLRPGRRSLTLVGSPADSVDDGSLITLFDSGGAGDPQPGEDPGPPTVRALAKAVARIGKYDGVRARFRRGGGGQRAYRDADLRISGRVTVPLRVVR